jgi:hypothetical protein
MKATTGLAPRVEVLAALYRSLPPICPVLSAKAENLKKAEVEVDEFTYPLLSYPY